MNKDCLVTTRTLNISVLVHNCTCKHSEMSVCAPEYCGLVSSAETEQSLLRVPETDPLATRVRWAGAPEVDPHYSPTMSAVVSASSDSLLALLELTGEGKLPQPPLTTGCLALCGCLPPTQSPSSTFQWVLRQKKTKHLTYVLQTVLNPERGLITRPDPPFSPALAHVSHRRSQISSTCVSCDVILMPWIP